MHNCQRVSKQLCTMPGLFH